MHIIDGFKFYDIMKMVYVTTFLGVSTTLFLIGILGIVLNRKNILIILMSVELMLLAVNINFVVFSVYLLVSLSAIDSDGLIGNCRPDEFGFVD